MAEASGTTFLDPDDGAKMLDTDGSVRLADGVSDACCCGGDDVCPDEVSATLQAKVYRIAGYTNGDIGACAECAASGATAWDGTFTWNTDLWREATSPLSIDGKVLDIVAIYHKSYIAYPDPGCWGLVLACGDTVTMWWGFKAGGSSPAGVYTRRTGADGGCDTTATITIEEVP
jgi:hypothetical protein